MGRNTANKRRSNVSHAPVPADLDSEKHRFPVDQSNLTAEERKLLADPDWIDEDEADIIICKRREAEGHPSIPIEEIMRDLGIPVED
jgi:hypothetical protein